MDYSIKIGGEAGQGLQTVGEILARVFSKAGYQVFTHQDYESRVRGGHNFYQIRVSDTPVMSPLENMDIIVALDRASIELHRGEITEEGVILYDSELIKENIEDPAFLSIPFKKLAVDEGGSPVMSNTVATGAVLGMLGMDISTLELLLGETFKKKGDAVIESNIKAARAGYNYAREKCRRCSFSITSSSANGRMLINGIEAIALGALASGCKFYSAYPMTPSTGIMTYLAGKAKEYGIVVEQAEDEIAAINMALGASFAGVRAMTGSAGGGFALMVEGLSLAAMTETPIVIAEGQRPAPATGFPTRTEQGDLLFILHTAHGEFPRVVFTPGNPEEAFYLTNRAFDLAEKYQIPAFIIFDTYLADTQWTYDSLDLSKLIYKDYRLRGEAFQALKEYKRHAYTDTGVTPFGVPGDATHVVVTDSDEHDEEGHMVEDAQTRLKMIDKRLFRKLEHLKKEINPPVFYGSEKPDIVLVGWGSTCGVIKEAVDVLSPPHPPLSKGGGIACLHFSEVYPFPSSIPLPQGEGTKGRVSDYLGILKNAKLAICIENNATGQFARHMKAETGYEFKASINRFDGRPFLLEELLDNIKNKI